jgi:hypothetical protein
MLKIENIDLETEMQQRQKAGEYFADLTDSLSASLDTFITKTNSLMEDGNANPAIFIALAVAAALETDHVAGMASAMSRVLKTALLPLSDRKINKDLEKRLSQSHSLVQNLVSAVGSTTEKQAVEAARKHQNQQLRESTFWLLASAMPTLTAFTQSLSNLQVALKDCTYALLGESDADIKRLFQASSERYEAEHTAQLESFLQEDLDPAETLRDLKSDYRQNPAVALYIKSSTDIPHIIHKLREQQQTESVLLDLYEYRMKQKALQSRISKQRKKKAVINIEHLTNNGVINEISGSSVQIEGGSASNPQIEQ